eukprot:CAMPEP_0177303130 /NCGR_PEP_ID=MMETSP0368-20130122/5970_1 /TAXON_ID=447022 ORGANISM="Scrippsiella hangoei-like, Strain SHHI-4" /NCGR_SAMPLE_ID=MMETSP0368 /ASSEMBLY_ACC=CAM_ASM_000363 /LENGTH=57 /DNA_ID=CAMNT_0018761659 /DNA_START=79 /DNA_END=249 /DNA_ORIENTATION=+
MPQVGMAEAQGIRQGGNANSSALAAGGKRPKQSREDLWGMPEHVDAAAEAEPDQGQP